MKNRRWILDVVMALVLTGLVLVSTRTCGPFGISWRLSYELWDAPCAPTVKQRVDLWLHSRRPLFAAAEQRFHVDRRAIAGVIAYEALEDFHPGTFFGLTRSDGPGKVHYKDGYLSEGFPAAKQVETLGLLPSRSMIQRRRTLSTDKGAIRYIAAILSALVADASHAGYSAACSPAILATFYTGWSPVTANRLFAIRRFPAHLHLNTAGTWVNDHRLELERDVGVPAKKDCSQPE